MLFKVNVSQLNTEKHVKEIPSVIYVLILYLKYFKAVSRSSAGGNKNSSLSSRDR